MLTAEHTTRTHSTLSRTQASLLGPVHSTKSTKCSVCSTHGCRGPQPELCMCRDAQSAAPMLLYMHSCASCVSSKHSVCTDVFHAHPALRVQHAPLSLQH